MISTQTLTLLTYSSLFILLSILETCNASCTPSSCGEVRNIKPPFRLSNDPLHCGDPRAELVCENNLTTIYLDSHKYYLKSIDYHNFSVRLTDSFVHDSSSICTLFSPSSYSDPYAWRSEGINRAVNFISCANPLQNSSLFTRVPDCKEGTHTYVKVGWMNLGEVAYTWTIDAVLPTYWDFGDPHRDVLEDLSNVSVSEIRESLLYGYNLSWFLFICGNCRYGCSALGTDGLVICNDYPSYLSYKWARLMDSFRLPPEGPVAGCLMIFILVAGVVFAGVSIPAKIIIGFGGSYLALVEDWDRKDIQLIIDVTFGLRFSVGFLCAMGFLIYKFRRRRLSEYEEIEGYLQSDNKLAPIRYSYSDLKKMTGGFRETLGEGGFGTVYKGKLRSGHLVAVKLLGKVKTKGQDFINEIGTIGRIHHVNVVKLVGYCAERSKQGIVFDFMPNGSLDKYIFNREKTHPSEKTHPLDWDKKFKIAVGVARGIEYLHRGCDIQILHFDIKPHNVLLDDEFVPKVSDFGLAKLCSIEKDNVTLTAARGTIGYVAPELINRSIGAVSYKADVYSFGMLLMEMVGLNRELKGNVDDSTKYFPQWIYESVNQGKDIEIEKADESSGNDENETTKRLVRKMTIVALWCIQMNPNDRPSMNRVLQMLEDNLENLQIPEYPSQSSHIRVNEEESWDTGAIDPDSASLIHNASSIEISIA